jgi:hypothetical protein
VLKVVTEVEIEVVVEEESMVGLWKHEPGYSGPTRLSSEAQDAGRLKLLRD